MFPSSHRIRIAARLILFVAAFAEVAFAQQQSADAAPRLINQPDNPLLNGFRWRAIGPVGPGGRVDDFAVDERNPSTYYVGFAVGGVMKTTNNGTTFEHVFDTYGASSIADIALAPSDPNIVYVATGEANNRQTTSYGDGIYKSTDGGKSFTNVGLRSAQTLGRVIVHPRDPNIVWVAVGGHLYGPNAERGVYMTTDGGKNWVKSLYVDENTGATELVIDPSNPLNLWAALYQRQRTAWGYNGGGKGSGIYQTTDGGKSWKRVTAPGLPHGTMGRIALDICKTQPNVIYAQIESAKDKDSTGGNGIWRSNDKGRSWKFVSNENQRPSYFSQLRVDPNNPEIVYLGGVGPTKSTDGGKTWHGLNNMGHVDNHALWIDPLNSRHVMYGNDGGVDVTWDAGAKWTALRPWPAGLAYHTSADMRRPYFVCVGLQDNGSWCGPSSVRNDELREGGLHQWMWFRTGGGDGFQNAMDPTDYHIFYVESQNASLTRYNTTTGEAKSIKPTLGGGRGGRGGRGGAAAGAESGGEGEAGPAVSTSNIINPIRGATIQFNWNSPVLLSPHSPSVIYVGGRSLFISRDRGTSWTMTKELGKGADLNARQIMGTPYSEPSCSGRGGGAPVGAACILSKGDGYAANEFGTLTEIAESPVVPGILWTGTDDGNLQLSRDAGYTWEEVGKNIPGVSHDYYVSGIEASWYDAATAYVALDGHRNDDLKPYIFKTTDYGHTWTPVSGNLPASGNVNSIRQDPVNRNLLYAPTELGFFVSLNDGKSWNRFMPNLPIGRIDEVLVHPRDNDLILSTHSRSVWILDDVSALQHMTQETLDKDAVLLPIRDAIAWKPDHRLAAAVPGDENWVGENAPRGSAISWYLKSAGGDTKVTITDAVSGQLVRTQTTRSEAGLNRWQWNLCSTAVRPPNPPPDFRSGSITSGFSCPGGGYSAPPGTYRVTVNVAGRDIGTGLVKVLEDSWLNEL